jgi:guanylate kinase
LTLLILIGPAGVGKGSLVSKLLESEPDLLLSVSATTRQPRHGEIDGVHYHFVSREKFETLIGQGKFLEWAQVHGRNYYGTPRAELAKAEAAGKHLVLEIDLQGARQIRGKVEDALSVFILPPSMEELERRLRGRGTETASQIETRLTAAKTELAAAGEFDYQIVNEDLNQTALQIIELIHKQKKDD